MRNQSKYFLTVTLAIMTLTGCGSEANEPADSGDLATPSFSASIGRDQSRAFDTHWDVGDEIGISGVGRANVAYYTADGDGNFSIKTPGDQIYFQSDDVVTFTAYWPWNALAAGECLISADTRQQAQQYNFDFLWASSTGKKTQPNVSFNFAHKMVKLSLTVKAGTAMTYEELKNVVFSMNGFKPSGFFNIADGSATASGEGVLWSFSDFAQFDDADGVAAFSMIFFPQTFTDPLEIRADLTNSNNELLSLKANIDFTAANSGKDGSNAKNEWVSGRQYNLSLTLNKTEFGVSECVINPWTDVSGNPIVVD